MLAVRRARLPEERPHIDAIHDACFEATHRALIATSEGHATPWFQLEGTCFVAEQSGSRGPIISGFIYVVTTEAEVGESLSSEEEPPLPRVDDLFVHPDAQGQGIGSRLISRAEDFVRERAT